jgi:thymidylate synthase (FAD)
VTEVRLIASTVFDLKEVDDLIQWDDERIDGRNDPDMLAEFAGRLCYWSYHRPTEFTARNEAYVQSVIGKKHLSVIEHASATFLLLDVSRSLTHELIRHRHLSFSQVSQRYVDESLSHVVIPPILRDATGPQAELLERNVMGLDNIAHELYSKIYQWAIDRGASRKEARGAARAVLPTNTRTSIVVSGNMRGWFEFLEKRLSRAAEHEIREVAEQIFVHLENLAPAIFSQVKAQ